jgi:hypothetical protein
MLTSILLTKNSLTTTNTALLATSPKPISRPAPFFQHFSIGELSSTLKISFTIEAAVTIINGFPTVPLPSQNGFPEPIPLPTVGGKIITVGKGTLWRASRALLTGTTLRLLEQVVILAIGARLFSEIFLEDAAEVTRDTEKLRSNSSEVIARAESSLGAFSSGIRTTVLYHASVALVGVGEYYLNSYLRGQKKNRDSKERDPQEVSEWKQHAWSMFCWSTLTTGLGAGIGTFIAPGVGSAVGRLIGMNIIYLTASEPQWRD